ncbi:Small acidic-like protein [Melia azedarach]|uniref:Small acidic-like protein n=1 Tax=Melia azedarach TaxID=155640 RepID=A0ACC1X7T8_MELAZ|nr:Small acidic-like protein [Melia azedarach]
MSSNRRGPPKHQNSYAWKANAGTKINEREVGGKLRPFSEITGVCPRCKEQIDWKRRYGKYKPLSEPAKCQRCSKRAVRQAYHSLCPGCAKEQNVCAKCCCRVDRVIGRDLAEVEAEQKMLELAIKNSRERDRRTLLRAMDKGKSNNSVRDPTNKNKVGDLFPAASLEEYAAKGRRDKDNNDGDDDGDGVGDDNNKTNDEDDDVDDEAGDGELDDHAEDSDLDNKDDTDNVDRVGN